MKKTIIINLPMSVKQKCVYENGILNEKISTDSFYFPINAYLAENLRPEDECKFIFIIKDDGLNREKEVQQICINEISTINNTIGAKLEFVGILTSFEQNKFVYDITLASLINEIEDGSSIYWDNTFGPKDVPLVIFAALQYCEKHLNCNVEHVFYGQGTFDNNGKLISTKLVSMDSLFWIISLLNCVESETPEQARELINMITKL